MSLNHVILGLLEREPLTGYEIKKIIQSTPFMYWSGNNNQIYTAFTELLKEGYVTKEVQHQEGLPSKNIYTITDSGKAELKKWLLTVTEEPVFKKQILIKLALAKNISRGELESMLEAYSNVVKMQAALSERELEKSCFSGSDAAVTFIDLIKENIHSFYFSEFEWIHKVKDYIKGLPDDKFAPEAGTEEVTNNKDRKNNEKEISNVNYQVKENRGRKYLYITSIEPLIQRERDAVDIISLCMENDVNAVVLEGNALSDDFVKLRTGLAGAVLQKFVNYNIKVAVVLRNEGIFPERFQEMVFEQSKGNAFRIFTRPEDAENWLLA